MFERSSNTYPGEVKPNGFPSIFIEKKFRNRWIGLVYYLLKDRPSIVISSDYYSLRSLIALVYAKLFKKRFVLWIEQWRRPTISSGTINGHWWYVKYLISIQLIRNSHSLVAGGSASEKYALSLGKNNKDIFMAIQCSDDLSLRYNVNSKKSNRNGNKYTFLYLSRVLPRKGLDLLIEAFSLLRELRADVFLTIGGAGPFCNYCEELVKSRKIPDISFIGSIDPNEVVDVYEQADVFVLPSYFRGNQYEAWGLVINEAMSMRLPVITTTAVGASYDLLLDGYNGFLVKENNILDLYKAMEKILSLDLVQMGRNSRTVFDQKNDFNKMADAFTSAIDHAKTKDTS